MAISFDSLPSARPAGNVIEKGTYFAEITSAEMRQPKDVTKMPYLNLCYDLKDANGKSMGKVYDILSESEKELIKFKLNRFICALNLDKVLTGTFELSDLCKIVKGKKFIVDIIPEKQDGELTGRTVVDVFSNGIYYSLSQANEIFKDTAAPTTLHVIDEPDAADATVHNDNDLSDDIF